MPSWFLNVYKAIEKKVPIIITRRGCCTKPSLKFPAVYAYPNQPNHARNAIPLLLPLTKKGRHLQLRGNTVPELFPGVDELVGHDVAEVLQVAQPLFQGLDGGCAL